MFFSGTFSFLSAFLCLLGEREEEEEKEEEKQGALTPRLPMLIRQTSDRFRRKGREGRLIFYMATLLASCPPKRVISSKFHLSLRYLRMKIKKFEISMERWRVHSHAKGGEVKYGKTLSQSE